jgi:regulator of cell morphogenesis and NO signaling
MADVIERVVSLHHTTLRAQAVRVEQISRDIHAFGGADDPVLLEIRTLVSGLRACIDEQLDKEERALFPMLRRLEQQSVVTRCHAGMIRSRIQMAERDLARIRGVLVRLRGLAREHLSPAGPCEACHELIRVIDEVVIDLREHARLECEVLFPWAIEREAALVAD